MDKNARRLYVENYYKLYDDNSDVLTLGDEVECVGEFLIKNTYGKILDIGCGPVPQIRSLCMPHIQEYYAMDLPQESIEYVGEKLNTKLKWISRFNLYKEFVEQHIGNTLPESYLLDQINKIISVRQADISATIPYDNNFFDTVLSLYSLGTLKNESSLDDAINNITRVLKSGGTFIHVNTNGQNTNTVLPEYTRQGLSQSAELITQYIKKYNYIDISLHQFYISSESLYSYDQISIIIAKKIM